MLLTIELQDNFPFRCSKSKSCYATCKAVGTAQRLLALLKGCWHCSIKKLLRYLQSCWHCSKAVDTAQRLLTLLKGCWNCSKAVGTAQRLSPNGTLSFCCLGETGLRCWICEVEELQHASVVSPPNLRTAIKLFIQRHDGCDCAHPLAGGICPEPPRPCTFDKWCLSEPESLMHTVSVTNDVFLRRNSSALSTVTSSLLFFSTS